MGSLLTRDNCPYADVQSQPEQQPEPAQQPELQPELAQQPELQPELAQQPELQQELQPEPTQQGQEDQTDLFCTTTSAADLPPEILEQIFRWIPAKERPVVAAVCRSWKHEFLETSCCWAGMPFSNRPS